MLQTAETEVDLGENMPFLGTLLKKGAGHRGNSPHQVHAQVLMFFQGLLYRLREQDVSVGITEALALAAALKAGAHDDTVRGFYYAARATMIHHEGHLDAFDWPSSPSTATSTGTPRSPSNRSGSTSRTCA